MKELAKVLIVTALLIGAAALAIHGCQDRELFVPPPDAVAEGFMREVLQERFDEASEYLIDRSAGGDLAALASEIERNLGHVDDIQAKTISSTKNEALVNVRLRSAKGSEALSVETVWNGAEWKVVMPPGGA